jgi:hypothetical protein
VPQHTTSAISITAHELQGENCTIWSFISCQNHQLQATICLPADIVIFIIIVSSVTKSRNKEPAPNFKNDEVEATIT